MTFYVCIWSFVIFQCCLEGYKWYDHCNFFPINWTSAIVILPLVSTGSAHVLVATRDQDHLRDRYHPKTKVEKFMYHLPTEKNQFLIMVVLCYHNQE